MKHVFLICVLAVLSCNDNKTDQVQSFITGTYFRKINNEFTVGFDTLVISAINENTYSILKSASFNRIRNDEIMRPERRSEKWTALYNKDEQVLHEVQKGKVISFLPKENTLLVGSSKYKKIKD